APRVLTGLPRARGGRDRRPRRPRCRTRRRDLSHTVFPSEDRIRPGFLTPKRVADQLVKKLGTLRMGGVAKNGFTISSIIWPTTTAAAGSVTRLSSSLGSFTRSKSCAG